MVSTVTKDDILLDGITFVNALEGEVVELVVSDLSKGNGGWIATPNVDILRHAHKHVESHALLEKATLRVVDGIPLMWAARLAGTPFRGRVAGSDLILSLSKEAANHGYKVHLLGGREGAGERAVANLRKQFSGLQVSFDCPPIGFDTDANEMQRVADNIERSGANIVFCGLGFPKQEQVIDKLRERFDAVWFAGIGGSIDLVAGDLSRAPMWMQKSGLEWAFRLKQEPARLFRRYIINDLPYLARLLSSILLKRIRSRS